MSEKIDLETHNRVVDFGKHKGELWTRVPADYLRWLANSKEDTINVKLARAELDRRGTKVSHEVEISPHAVDRASIRCRKIWHRTALSQDEGIYSWLSRVATEALNSVTTEPKPEKIRYIGMDFIFKQGEIYPILKSVFNKEPWHPKNCKCFCHTARYKGLDIPCRKCK
jgi:hypothetical protein